MKYIPLFLVLLLAACDRTTIPKPDSDEKLTVDQCLRHAIFTSCLTKLPPGPASTKFNDWDEVIDSCAKVAFYQSLRFKKHVQSECSGGPAGL